MEVTENWMTEDPVPIRQDRLEGDTCVNNPKVIYV